MQWYRCKASAKAAPHPLTTYKKVVLQRRLASTREGNVSNHSINTLLKVRVWRGIPLVKGISKPLRAAAMILRTHKVTGTIVANHPSIIIPNFQRKSQVKSSYAYDITQGSKFDIYRAVCYYKSWQYHLSLNLWYCYEGREGTQFPRLDPSGSSW